MAVMVVVKELLASKTLSKVHLLEGRAALVFTFPSLSPFFAFFLFPSPHFIGHTGRVISSCVDDTTMAPADSSRVVVSDGAEREREKGRKGKDDDDDDNDGDDDDDENWRNHGSTARAAIQIVGSTCRRRRLHRCTPWTESVPLQ